MSDLQRYTHKVSLAIQYQNIKRSRFCLHESIVSLETIQSELPEYEGLALHINRFALSVYKKAQEALK